MTASIGAAPGTVAALVAEVAAALAERGRFDDETALAEAGEIVAALVEMPRWWPRRHAASPVDAALRVRALAAASRRARGAPLAYAVGRAAFRHLVLDVDERVLIPRPETELLVDLVLARAAHGVVVDVGTGSGAIALALASEGAYDRVIACDVSRDALAVAARNAAALDARGALRCPVALVHGALLAPLRARGERANVVVSNPPYIAHDEAAALPADVRDWEPPLALYSDGAGLAVTARLVREARDVLASGGLLALEVDARRAALAAECVAGARAYKDVEVRLDLAGRERFVLAVRR